MSIIPPKQIEYMLVWMYSADAVRNELAEGVVWEIISDHTEDVGFWSATLGEDGTGKLNKLYLLPSHQGQGTGQIVLSRIFDLAAKCGVREMRLQVNKSNVRAQRAYEKFGFTRIDEGIFEIGGGYVMDDYIFARSVASATALKKNPKPASDAAC